MEKTPENGYEINKSEASKQERGVQLADTFKLFETSYVERSEEGLRVNLLILTESIPPVPLEVYARRVEEATSLYGITPFDPEMGYQITKEDATFETRKKKVVELSEKGGKSITDVAPLWLTFNSSGEDLERAGFVTKRMRVWDGGILEAPFFTAKSQEYYDFLKSLRVKVSFPSGKVYESKPDGSCFQPKREILNLRFANFYPVEIGPLAILSAQDTGTIPRHEGLEVFLPDKTKDLSRIETSIIEGNSGS